MTACLRLRSLSRPFRDDVALAVDDDDDDDSRGKGTRRGGSWRAPLAKNSDSERALGEELGERIFDVPSSEQWEESVNRVPYIPETRTGPSCNVLSLSLSLTLACEKAPRVTEANLLSLRPLYAKNGALCWGYLGRNVPRFYFSPN